jgi:hypothetical protein
MNIEKLKETLLQLIPDPNKKLKFQIILEEDYRSWEPLSLEDLITPEDLLDKVNHYLNLGAKLEYETAEKFEDSEELIDNIYDSELYINTSNAEESKEKNHKLILYFLAPFEILENQEFIEILNTGEVKAFICELNGFMIKIECI